MIGYILLAGSTLVSEDLACVAAGLLVARGSLNFLGAALSCFTGILAGDLGLFALGRFVGRSVLEWRPFRSITRSAAFAQASGWIERRGAAVILLSRFTPGLRLPAYLSAGLSRAPLVSLLFWFVAACALWTPLLVGGSALFGAAFVRRLWLAAPCCLFIWFLGTRKRAWWHRLTHWEFWPAWVAYLPLVPWLLFLTARHRSLTLFTLSNPGIEGGGLTGESKTRILEGLAGAPAFAAPFQTVSGPASFRDACAWMKERAISFPVVLKPDVGERGRGVAIVSSKGAMARYLHSAIGPTIVQQYVEGDEFGIFYYRRPSESGGHILSVTAKILPHVTGDGVRSVRDLINADPRAFCMIDAYLEELDAEYVPAQGECVPLVRIGSHCRGAVFLDASHLATEALRAAVDSVSRRHAGFYFGRFDVKSGSQDALRKGRFTVLELNGVGAEAAHIYDPAVGLIDAYRSLFRQWKIAFDIGAENRRRGSRPPSISEMVRLLRGKRWPPPVLNSGSGAVALFVSDPQASAHPACSQNRDRSETRAA